MSAPSPGTSTRFRLARITGLVLGSLVFLHACERSKSTLLGDVRMEVAIAAALGAAALAAGWFEIKLRAQEEKDAGPSWDDSEEDETPSPGNFPGRSRRSAHAVSPERARAGHTRPVTRPAPPTHLEDDDQPEPSEPAGRADLVAGIARTLRITRPGATGERPQLPALSAMTKWMRRVEPGEDADLDEVGDDEVEQITHTETGELVIESSSRTVRAKIARSGDLVVHGRAHGGPHPRSEWKWTFQPETFPAIRNALGDGPGDLLDLLEDTIPWLDAGARHDPGAWLRAHDIPATYREKGVSATQVTRELPVLQPGRPPQPPRAGRSRRKPSPDASGTRTARTSTGTGDDRARRERPAASARSPEPSPARRESRSTQRGAAGPLPSSGRTDTERRTRGDKSRPTGQQSRSSDDYGSPTPSRRRRDESAPSDRFPRTGTDDSSPPGRPTPGRPDLPRRRHKDIADDHRDTLHDAGRPEGHDDTRRRRASRQADRNSQPFPDFEPRTGRRERSDPPYRDRPAPSDRAGDRTHDQPPPARRHRGEERPRRDTPSAQEHTSRRGW
ncbi:hypothetical protein IU470_17190 [Nocardia abscessus]|uniref:Uncharacterized protein n=1 Tax=Nocardia abscessus TaxID=120957 RepID=A0ABS0CBE9_9NOCA|nr:hypothetical protein [Nocardia abscessus]MBF6226833.1 hypothetical protein [Nocardia abscessus]